MTFSNPAWSNRPLRTSLRVLKSLARRSIRPLREPVVPYDGSRIVADLHTALGLQIYRYGYSDPDIDLVAKLLAPGDVFVDGGANIGLFTLAAASRVGPTGVVVSFEPGSLQRRALERNVQLNGFDWVRIRSEALDEVAGTRNFAALTGDSTGLSSFQPDAAVDSEKVASVTLDDALPSAERDRIALIKLDLEGAEYGALLGARKILEHPGPDFVIEIEPAHLARQGASTEKLIQLFKAHGYAFFRPTRGPNGEVELVTETHPGRASSSPNHFVSRHLVRVERAGIRVHS